MVEIERGKDVAVQDVLLEISYRIEGTAEVWLNGKRWSSISGKDGIRYWFSSRGWNWKLGTNKLEFRLSKDAKNFVVKEASIVYGYN